MCIFRDLESEEPVLSSGYLCVFKDLTVRSVMMDEVIATPEKPARDMMIDYETNTLRHARELLNVGLEDATQYIEDNAHPRLWKLLSGAALKALSFTLAEKCFVNCADYQGIQFVKRLRELKDKNKQRAEVMAYFQEFGNDIQIKSVIDANVIPPLIKLLANAEYDIKKQAAWAISNATSGGTPEQINFLVAEGCVPPLCDLLENSDAKIVTVALEGLENILKVGATMAESSPTGENPHALTVERAEGLEKIDNLQNHENNDIYERAVKILEKYFGAATTNLASKTQPVQTLEQVTLPSPIWMKKVARCIRKRLSSIPPLIKLLANTEFDIKKEAAEQINFLVAEGCVPPLCDLLEDSDTKIVTVALEGLENILKVGATMAESSPTGENPHALTVERAEGLKKIDNLQNHESDGIYERAVKILRKYFGAVDEE